MKMTEINTVVVCRKNKVINIAKNIHTYKRRLLFRERYKNETEIAI